MMLMRSDELTSYSRRDFGKLVLAGLPLTLAFKGLDSKINGVQIGSITYSFRTIPDAEEIIKAYQKLGLSEVELMSNHAEALAGAPASGSPAGGGGRRGEQTPEQQEAAKKAAQARAEELR